MAGSRIGWAVGNADIIANLYAFRTNMGYGTPVAIQEGAIVALDRAPEFVKDVVSGYQARRELLVKGFQKLGWQITSPRAAMYVWLKVPKGFTSQEWARHLIDECDVVVTPGNAFGDGGEGWFRVSMVSPEPVLQTALDRLESKGIRYN
jgi:LL-diaminopimelate aminotransferase